MNKTNEPIVSPVDTVDIRLPSDEIWENNKGKIFAGIAAFIVVSLAVIGWTAWSRDQKTSAARAFTAATEEPALREVIAKWPNTPAAENASLLLAEVLRDAGKSPEAAELYTKILDSRTTYPLRAAAALGEAELLSLAQSESDPAAVASAFQSAVTAFPGSYIVAYSLFTAGEIYSRLDRTQDALAAYRALLAEAPGSFLAEAASAKVQEMDSQSPSPSVP